MNRRQRGKEIRILPLAASLGLHAILLGVGYLFTWKSQVQPALTFTLDRVRDEQLELQVLHIAAAELPSKMLNEPLTNALIAVPPLSVADAEGFNNSLAGLGGGASSEGEVSDSQPSDLAENLLAHPVIGMLDTSRYFGDDPAGLRVRIGGTTETRREMLSAVSAELIRIRPQHISSVVFVPLRDSATVRRPESESVREMVLDWAERMFERDSSDERSYVVRPSTHLIVIVSESPLPMEKLRQVASRWHLRLPMQVVCLKSSRSFAHEWQSLAFASGSDYFGSE